MVSSVTCPQAKGQITRNSMSVILCFQVSIPVYASCFPEPSDGLFVCLFLFWPEKKVSSVRQFQFTMEVLFFFFILSIIRSRPSLLGIHKTMIHLIMKDISELIKYEVYIYSVYFCSCSMSSSSHCCPLTGSVVCSTGLFPSVFYPYL